MLMNDEIEAQVHFWPWSNGIPEETRNLREGKESFPFWGTPVISLAKGTELFLSQRHERFVPLGPEFKSIGGFYQLYEMPHGDPARKGENGYSGQIRVRTPNERFTLCLEPQGGRKRLSNEKEETELARTVLGWSQLFDDLLDIAMEEQQEARLPWKKIERYLVKIRDEVNQPRMALIVYIAQKIQRRLSHTVTAARKVLLRERRMMPADRVAETDMACLRWYLRQPGETAFQKAAANRQNLLAVARRESHDTYENRILKDFIVRCQNESFRYLTAEVGDNGPYQNSTRCRCVREYSHLCSDLLRNEFIKNVSKPEPGLQPNYVLQNDYRYREIYKLYRRLIKHEDEEDRLWDWQSRTFADIVRLLICRALFTRSEELNGFKEMFKSSLRLRKEQLLGGRLLPGCEPGPFHIMPGTLISKRFVLEIVHSDLAPDHPITKDLGRVGGHVYLVLNPIGPGRPAVIIIWAVHTAGARSHPSWKETAVSARAALTRHQGFIEERHPNPPKLHGLVVASDRKGDESQAYSGDENRLPLVTVTSNQAGWSDANIFLQYAIEEVMGEIK